MTIKDFRTPRGRDMGPGRVSAAHLTFDLPENGVPLQVAMHQLGDGMAPECPLCGTTGLEGRRACIPTLSGESKVSLNQRLRAAGVRQNGWYYV
jgi:hypothetical protein